MQQGSHKLSSSSLATRLTDLPAPLTPMTATRLASRAATLTSVSCGAAAPGYANVTLVSFAIGFSLLLMPSSRPGVGKLNLSVAASSS